MAPQAMEMTPVDSTSRDALRQALGRFATGVCVLTGRDAEGHPFGMTINSFGSVSLSPAKVLWTLDKSTVDVARYLECVRFGVSVLHREQGALCFAFADERLERFDDLDWPDSAAGCPVVPEALAVFDCAVDTVLEVGDHHLVISDVTAISVAEGSPLVFQGGQLADALPQPSEEASGDAFAGVYSGALIGRASAAVNRDFAARLPSTLKPVHWRVLACLVDADMTVNNLAEDVLVKQPTLTRILDGMVESGLVGRREDPADRRKVMITATDAGRTMGEQLRRDAMAREAEVFAGWSSAERAQLWRLLNRLVQASD